ncbi:MAG: SPFH domain-containing protein [Myxococcales bacterium]|nr:SPFH domain-containing protein [Myxococcales bacterium]
MARTQRSILIVAAAACLALGCSNPYTPPGHEGYVYERPRLVGTGGPQGTVTGPGNFGVSILRNEIVNIDVRPQTYTEAFQILARDDLNVSFQVHAVLAIEPGNVEDVVLRFGSQQWYARVVKEPFRTLVRRSVQTHDSREIKALRMEIADEVRAGLAEHLTGTPFRVRSLVVGNIDYPAVVADAVEKKLASRQLLEEKATQKEIAMRDAEIRVEEAKGIAEAQRIINETLTANYLQHEAIGAQLEMASSPNHTTVYIPVGNNGLPLVHTPTR